MGCCVVLGEGRGSQRVGASLTPFILILRERARVQARAWEQGRGGGGERGSQAGSALGGPQTYELRGHDLRQSQEPETYRLSRASAPLSHV